MPIVLLLCIQTSLSKTRVFSFACMAFADFTLPHDFFVMPLSSGFLPILVLLKFKVLFCFAPQDVRGVAVTGLAPTTRAVMYCIVSYCIILYRIVSYCIVLYRMSPQVARGAAVTGPAPTTRVVTSPPVNVSVSPASLDARVTSASTTTTASQRTDVKVSLHGCHGNTSGDSRNI